MFTKTLSLCVAFAALIVSNIPAEAALIAPVSAAGTGTFSNSPNLIINGIVAPRNTAYFSSTNVYWTNSTTPTFTINLGGLYTIQNLTVGVDNNDDYQIQYSTDGTTFTNLFKFVASDGPVSVGAGGMDILTTDSGFPVVPGNTTTPAYVGRSFSPVDAQFLRIFVTAGDNFYAISEVQAFGVAVPEPSSVLGLLGFGTIGGFAFRRRRINKKTANS
jgi:hypothetical protein